MNPMLLKKLRALETEDERYSQMHSAIEDIEESYDPRIETEFPLEVRSLNKMRLESVADILRWKREWIGLLNHPRRIELKNGEHRE